MEKLKADMRRNQHTIGALIERKSLENSKKKSKRNYPAGLPRSPRDSSRKSKRSKRANSSIDMSKIWDNYDSKEVVVSKYDSKISMGSKEPFSLA